MFGFNMLNMLFSFLTSKMWRLNYWNLWKCRNGKNHYSDLSGAKLQTLEFDVPSWRGVLPAVDISAWWRFFVGHMKGWLHWFPWKALQGCPLYLPCMHWRSSPWNSTGVISSQKLTGPEDKLYVTHVFLLSSLWILFIFISYTVCIWQMLLSKRTVWLTVHFILYMGTLLKNQ